MKRAIFLFVFLLVLANVNAKLNSVEQQHTTESYNKRVTLFERLSSLLSSLIQNNNADFGTKVVSFRKLDRLNLTNKTHNSSSNSFLINVTSNASAEVCYSGTLNIVTSTDGLNVKVNNIYEGQTDYSYFIQKEITLANCQSSYNVDIYCYDNATLCYSETAYIPNNGETATVVESDCVKTCSTDANLWLTNKDIKIKGNNINVTIHSSNINGNVDISMYRINEETGLVDDTKVLQTNIDSYSTSSVAADWDLSSAYAINVYIDESGEFDENKDDNFVYRLISDNIPKAYLSVNTSYPEVSYLIKDYLKQYVYYTENPDEAELIISVGKFTQEFKEANPETLKPSGLWWWKELGYGYKNGGIFAYGDYAYSTYSGIVARTNYNSKPLILAYGIGVDGDIVSVKKLISARELMFSDISNPEKPPVIMDRYDTLALGVNNLLKSFTDYSLPQFLSVVNKILFDNAYDVAIRTVKTLDTTSYGESTILRLKNVNSDYSEDFKDAISENDKPVVLARGLWSNLLTWEDFGKELASDPENARDTWLIEITGGQKQDCETCPNYEYEDLVDYYWPALIAGVEEYSGQNKLDYVGFSNGCRVGLDSLSDWSSTGKNNAGYYFNYDNGQYEFTDLSANPVDMFVGVGCPGAFDGTSLFGDCMLQHGQAILNHFANNGINHPTQTQFSEELARRSNFLSSCWTLSQFLESDNSISANLGQKYLDLIQSNQDKQPGEGLNLNKFYIIYGTNGFGFNNDNDYIVAENDELAIFSNIVSDNKEFISFHLRHNDLPDDEKTQNTIRRGLR